MHEGLVFLIAWLLPMLAWGGILLGVFAIRVHFAADDAHVGRVQPFLFVIVPYALGSVPITSFAYWALEAWK